MNDADLMSLIGMGGENAQLEDEMAQQQQKANMLRQMSQPLQGGQVGNHAWSPTALSQVLNAIPGMMAGQVDKKAAGNQTAINQNKQAQMAMLLRMLQGDPSQSQPPSQAMGPGMMPPNPQMPNGNGMVPPQGMM